MKKDWQQQMYEDYFPLVELKDNENKSMKTKPIWKSKTMYFNLIVFLVGFLSLPELVQLLPAGLLPYVTLSGVVGNMILRLYFTETAIR